MKRFLLKFVYWFLASTWIQKLMLKSGQKWVFIRRNDDRYLRSNVIVTADRDKVRPTGLVAVAVRKEWKDRGLFRAEGKGGSYVAFTDHNGMSMACLGERLSPGEEFTLGFGKESCEFYLLGTLSRPTLHFVCDLSKEESKKQPIKHL